VPTTRVPVSQRLQRAVCRHVAPKNALVADSLNSYSTAVVNHGYPLEDQSKKEHLWKITDGSDTPVGEYDPILVGSRSLWCGKYDRTSS